MLTEAIERSMWFSGTCDLYIYIFVGCGSVRSRKQCECWSSSFSAVFVSSGGMHGFVLCVDHSNIVRIQWFRESFVLAGAGTRWWVKVNSNGNFFFLFFFVLFRTHIIILQLFCQCCRWFRGVWKLASQWYGLRNAKMFCGRSFLSGTFHFYAFTKNLKL